MSRKGSSPQAETQRGSGQSLEPGPVLPDAQTSAISYQAGDRLSFDLPERAN